MSQVARVFLVGTGPGDPDLLTVKALRLIQECDVIVYDRLVSDEILQQIPAGITRIYVGKKTGKHTLPQGEINKLIVKLSNEGYTVVRLKGGDPFIFGRGSEEAEFLARNNIRFEIVPGITAASACTTYAGIPLTHRGLSKGIQIITGHCRSDQPLDYDWEKLADPDRTLVIYMGLANIDEIVNELINAGLSPETPAAAIENGTTVNQRQCITVLQDLVAELERNKFQAPVMLVIGKVVSMADLLGWYVPQSENYSDSVAQQHG